MALLFQIAFIIYFINNLNNLYYNLDTYNEDDQFESKFFYEFSASFFIILVFIFDGIISSINYFFTLNSEFFSFIAIYSIIIAFTIILYDPFILTLKWINRLTKKVLWTLGSFFKDIYLVYVNSILISTRVLVTSLASVILFFRIYYTFLLFFLFILITFLISIDNISLRKKISAFRRNQLESNDTVTNASNLYSSFHPKVFLYSFFSLIFSLITLATLSLSVKYLQNNLAFYTSIIIIILVNSLWIITTTQFLLKKLIYIIMETIRIIKFNTYYKMKFIYEINNKYGTFTGSDLLHLEINGFILSMIIFLILNSLFTNLLFIHVFYLILISFYLLFLQGLYNKVNSLIVKESSINSVSVNLYDKIKDFVFDNQQKRENKVISELNDHKLITKILFLIPLIPLIHFLFILVSNYLVSNILISLSLLIVLLLVSNIKLVLYVLQTIEYFFSNMLISTGTFLYRISYSFFMFLGNIFYQIFEFLYLILMKTYSVLFKKGRKSISIDYTLVVIFWLIFGPLIIKSQEFRYVFDLTYVIPFYIIFMVIIWYNIVYLYLSSVGLYFYLIFINLIMITYSILAKHGRKSASLDLFLIISGSLVLSDLLLGYNTTRTEIAIFLFILGLLIVWSAPILFYISKIINILVIKVKNLSISLQNLFKRLYIVIQYVK